MTRALYVHTVVANGHGTTTEWSTVRHRRYHGPRLRHGLLNNCTYRAIISDMKDTMDGTLGVCTNQPWSTGGIPLTGHGMARGL